jgi:hypothetical protein
MLGLICNSSIAIGVLRHLSVRTSLDSDEEEELNDALLQFGMHVSKGTNVAVGDNVSLDGLGSRVGSS